MLQYSGYLNTMIGILTPVLIVTSPLNLGHMIQEMRNWQSEQTRSPVEDSINKALEDLWEDEDGSNDTTIKEKLLQLQGDRDQ